MRRNWSDFSNVLMTATIVAVSNSESKRKSKKKKSQKQKHPTQGISKLVVLGFQKYFGIFSLYPISVNQYIKL